jgi:hypothetical protein
MPISFQTDLPILPIVGIRKAFDAQHAALKRFSAACP